ncbi:MAG: FAD-dependent oxidoreductase [Candidatus Dependentiae bacterium]|nr:FAD-dependent oxidoreductase [Candidatus Dependentiae bacterium]
MAYQARVFYVLPIILISMCMSGCFSKKNDPIHFNLDNALKFENVVPVAIVGSGPGGLSAALYVARAGMKAFVFGGPMPCGQLTQTTFIENWPGREKVLGIDLMNDVKNQAEFFGACIINDTIASVDFSQWPYLMKTEEGREFRALSVILATGANPKQLSIPGEKKYWGKGVTACAVCDASFCVGKEVVIVGGGDSAVEQVFELAPYVKKVTVLVRGESMRAAKLMQQRVLAYDNAEIQYNKELKAIHGDDTSVKSIDVYDSKTNTVENRPIEGVFLAIGHTPNTELFKKYLKVDELNYLVMEGRSQQTSQPGIFAAGEIQDHTYRQAAVAAGEGIKAALDATSFLYELGFNSKIGQALEENFFESFSDNRVELEEINLLADFNKNVVDAQGLVVIDFYSKTCPGCIRILPSLESLAYHLKDKITILKCNVNKSIEILKELKFNRGLHVKSVPAIFIFKDGKFIARTNSIMSKKELFTFIHQYMQD